MRIALIKLEFIKQLNVQLMLATQAELKIIIIIMAHIVNRKVKHRECQMLAYLRSMVLTCSS